MAIMESGQKLLSGWAGNDDAPGVEQDQIGVIGAAHGKSCPNSQVRTRWMGHWQSAHILSQCDGRGKALILVVNG